MPATYKKHWRSKNKQEKSAATEGNGARKASVTVMDEENFKRNADRSSTTAGIGVKREQSKGQLKPNLRGLKKGEA